MTDFSFTVYQGETFVQPVNLDGATENYDLTGRTLALPCAYYGSTATVVEFAPRPLTDEEFAALVPDVTLPDGVTAAEAGWLGIPLTAEVTAGLEPCMYSCQLWDTDQPLMLAKGTMIVRAGLVDAS